MPGDGTRRGYMKTLGAVGVGASLSGCVSVRSLPVIGCRLDRGPNIGPEEELEDPSTGPSWSNWTNMRPVLTPSETGQPTQVHNPIPIRWDDDWYMYAIDGDFSGRTVNTDLYKRQSDGEWTLHAENVLEGVEVNDVSVVDGTVYAYAGQSGTTVWTGDSLTDLSHRGTVADDIGDPGCYFDPETGLMHLYYELGDPPDTDFSGEYIGHSTSPNGVTDWTANDPVIDTTESGFDVGDPRLISVDEQLHLFVDYNRTDPLERIIHFHGTDYSNFQKGDVVVTGRDFSEGDESAGAVNHPYVDAVGDGAPRYIDGVWNLFFEVATDCGGEIWVAESAGPAPARSYEVEGAKRYSQSR